MFAKFLEAFDKHCIIYSALVGVALMPFTVQGQNPLVLPAVTAFLGTVVWYGLKALFITGSTVKNWDKTNPGEPMFSAGGLTEYDSAFAQRIGKSAGEGAAAAIRNTPTSGRPGTFYMKNETRERE